MMLTFGVFEVACVVVVGILLGYGASFKFHQWRQTQQRLAYQAELREAVRRQLGLAADETRQLKAQVGQLKTQIAVLSTRSRRVPPPVVTNVVQPREPMLPRLDRLDFADTQPFTR
jgi:cell division protein FtsB